MDKFSALKAAVCIAADKFSALKAAARIAAKNFDRWSKLAALTSEASSVLHTITLLETSQLITALLAELEELQEVLNRCPSKRLGFATAGDCDITVYDSSFSDLICKVLEHEGGDYIPTATKLGAVLGVIDFPAQVESTAG